MHCTVGRAWAFIQQVWMIFVHATQALTRYSNCVQLHAGNSSVLATTTSVNHWSLVKIQWCWQQGPAHFRWTCSCFDEALQQWVTLPTCLCQQYSQQTIGSSGSCSAVQGTVRASVEMSRQLRTWTHQYTGIHRVFQGVHRSRKPGSDKCWWIIVTHTHTLTLTNKFSPCVGHCHDQCGACSGCPNYSLPIKSTNIPIPSGDCRGIVHTGCSYYHTWLHADTHMYASNSSNQCSQAAALCTQAEKLE